MFLNHVTQIRCSWMKFNCNVDLYSFVSWGIVYYKKSYRSTCAETRMMTMQNSIQEKKNTHDVKRMGLLPKTRLVALGFTSQGIILQLIFPNEPLMIDDFFCHHNTYIQRFNVRIKSTGKSEGVCECQYMCAMPLQNTLFTLSSVWVRPNRSQPTIQYACLTMTAKI